MNLWFIPVLAVGSLGFWKVASAEVLVPIGVPATAPSVAPHSPCDPDLLLRGCPDDYCLKPCPRLKCLPCGLPDDYCRKPCPRLKCLPCGLPDDYCRKPCPNLCRPIWPGFYTCGHPDPKQVVVTGPPCR
jgi:hypothetical protein